MIGKPDRTICQWKADILENGPAYNFTNTKAAKYASTMIGKPDHTICQWKADNVENGSIPDYKQGRHQRTGVVWSSEELNQKATKYVREMPT